MDISEGRNLMRRKRKYETRCGGTVEPSDRSSNGICRPGRQRTVVFVLAAIISLALNLPATSGAVPDLQPFSFRSIQMGVEFRITVYGCDSHAANKAADAAFERVRELNAIMSDYDAASEVRQLCERGAGGVPVPASDELYTVLKQSIELWEETSGAFDVTVGPLTKLWRRARRRGEFPPEDLFQEARRRVGSHHLKLDDCRRTVTLRLPAMRIDLGGIAKGFAADEAMKVLRAHGFSRALVDASGDLVVGEAPPGKPGWRVAVPELQLKANVKTPWSPRQETRREEVSRVVLLRNRAIATSGSTVQFVEIDGTVYSHLLDPRTGLGLQAHSMVTVIAPTGAQSDSLASALSVLGPDDGMQLIERPAFCGVEARIQSVVAGTAVRQVNSAGFADFLNASGTDTALP